MIINLKEVYQALLLGTRDYIRKNNFKKVIFGISGGIDSALVALLAVDAIGKDNVTALSMPSQFTSKGTKDDARKISDNLGIKLMTIPIDDVYKVYLEVLKPHFKGLKSGVTEENLQARIRGNLLMAFSNKFGWLVLTTGNKSETSTGYCTLYGDMAGGFSVIKDVPKLLVYELTKYRNNLSKGRLIPKMVFTRPPTAELRLNQKDQDTLPPYRLLDKVLKLYVEDDKQVSEIAAQVHDAALVRRVVDMVDKSEYKRRQSPPGIKITPRAFGKDRRFPITNRYKER